MRQLFILCMVFVPGLAVSQYTGGAGDGYASTVTTVYLPDRNSKITVYIGDGTVMVLLAENINGQTLEIHNVAGQKLSEIFIPAGEIYSVINTAAFASGIYFIGMPGHAEKTLFINR